MISFIIPTYNESRYIQNTLNKLLEIIELEDEVIVVDGQSEDNTVALIKRFSKVRIIENCKRGRAVQMNRGAEVSNNNYLLFLHADTVLSKLGLKALKNTLKNDNVYWGWFKMRFDSNKYIYRVLEKLAEFRNDLIQEPVGDHGIFVRKTLFQQIGAYPEIQLMEDVELITKLKKLHNGNKINIPIFTSPRRFENSGIIKTTLNMCILRILHFFRIDTSFLSKHYKEYR